MFSGSQTQPSPSDVASSIVSVLLVDRVLEGLDNPSEVDGRPLAHDDALLVVFLQDLGAVVEALVALKAMKILKFPCPQ